VSFIAKWNAFSVPLYGEKGTSLIYSGKFNRKRGNQEAWKSSLYPMLAQAWQHSYSRKNAAFLRLEDGSVEGGDSLPPPLRREGTPAQRGSITEVPLLSHQYGVTTNYRDVPGHG